MEKKKAPKNTGKIVSITTDISSFGAILRAARKRNGLSMEQFAEMMGVTRFTVRNWEENLNKPDYDSLIQLCTVLNLPIQDLFPSKLGYTALERGIIQDVRRMKTETRVIASSLIKAMADEENSMRAKKLHEEVRIKPFYINATAAGTLGAGGSFSDEPPTPFYLKVNTLTSRADAVIRVSGHSMEPDYKPGDLVIFEYTDGAGDPGDDLVVAVEGESFIKHMDKGRKLCSLNPDYNFDYEGESEGVKILGRVLGILGPDDVCDEEDGLLLEEVFRNELAEFERNYNITY